MLCKFKGLGKSNQTYPGAAILDIWVKKHGKHVLAIQLQFRCRKIIKRSFKGLVRKCLLCEEHAQVGSFPLRLLFYPGKYKCKMVPFNKGSHLSVLRRREEEGRCISCIYLNGNLNGRQNISSNVGHCPELSFVRLPGCIPARPSHEMLQVFRTPTGLFVLPACLCSRY